MLQGHEKGVLENLDSELLAQLALECRDRLLALQYLAPREFPQAGEAMISGTLRDQYPTEMIAEDAGRNANAAQVSLPWHCLYFLPEPQGQGSLRPTFLAVLTKGV